MNIRSFVMAGLVPAMTKANSSSKRDRAYFFALAAFRASAMA